MGNVEKTVFISYRRTNLPWALAIYQNLTAKGYDVFFDYESIHSGDFEQVILGNIRARAHFLVVLTPSALERCNAPNDWLRREIETALDEKRNIVPLFLEGFDFGSLAIAQHLTGKLEKLKKYNGQNVPAGFFDEAMNRVCDKFLNVTLEAVLHPVSATVQKVVQKQQIAANEADLVKEKELKIQEQLEYIEKNKVVKNNPVIKEDSLPIPKRKTYENKQFSDVSKPNVYQQRNIDRPVELDKLPEDNQKNTLGNRQLGIITTVTTVLFCAVPGFLLCIFGFGVFTGNGTYSVGGTSQALPASYGFVFLCLSVILIAIPIVVGFFMLRKKPQASVSNEQIPPAS